MILDLGCGEKGSGDVNCDIRKYRQRNFVRCDCHYLPFRDRTFLEVRMFEVLEHLSEPILALSDVQRVLKSNGSIHLSIPNVYFFERSLRFIFRKKKLIELLEKRDITKFGHKQAWDVYALVSLCCQSELKVVDYTFWDRYSNSTERFVKKILYRFLPKIYGKHHVLFTLRPGRPEAVPLLADEQTMCERTGSAQPAHMEKQR